MGLDHLSFACGHEGLAETSDRLGRSLGAEFVDGGFHPRFGTRNRILPLADGTYLEVVEVLDHPAADKVPFGQAVRARSEAGGGWLGWAVRVDDLAPIEKRLGRAAVPGSRHVPNGDELTWQQIGIKGLQSDPQLPFFIKWSSDMALHPSNSGPTDPKIKLLGLEIAGDPDRVDDWLGGHADAVLTDFEIKWVAPNGQPGILAATFATPEGEVRI
jgi:catechol 2,3-dioxygenase-like lactoylglutathione lyase family enzyme